MGHGGIFWTLPALFKGQSFAAHGRGGLVTLSRQSNQRRTRHRKCLFARRPLPLQNKTEHPGCKSLSRATLRLYYPAMDKSLMPLSHCPTLFCFIFTRGCCDDTHRPTLFYLPFKKFVLARSKRGPARWQRRGNRKVSL